MESFAHLLHRWKKRGFVRAWANYETKCKDIGRTGSGDVFYNDVDGVSDALREIFPYTSLR
jgi:hypothetical protein